MKQYYLTILLFMTFCLGLASCQTAEGSFSRDQLLIDITNEVILPNHATFLATAEALETAVDAFATAPSLDNLSLMQAAWTDANVAWMGCALFRFGEVEDNLFHNRIDNRPPRTAFIDDAIVGNETLDQEFFNSIGSTSVGLGAIEHLIFDPEMGADHVLATFQENASGARRLAYLQGLTTNLTMQAGRLNQFWLDGYAEAFINGDMENEDLLGSINMLANRMIEDTEGILSSRLGKPMGKRSNGEIRPDLAESIYADISLLRIQKSLETLHVTYQGGEGVGLDDYLRAVDATFEEQPLADVIDARFEAAITAINAIEPPLTTAVATHPADVENAYEQVRLALILLKVDMPANLGLTITFSDNDGD